ncbi:MAG: protein kinase [Deltaproteobacteria bacterium]|nr:protein kinase [Deltaproteobacteria bacterium]
MVARERSESAENEQAELASLLRSRYLDAAMQLGASGRGRDGDDGAQPDPERAMSDSDVPGPNDPTRTRAPQPADAPPGPNDPTRTRAPGASDANAGTEPPARNDRLPAPLQYRDPDRYQVIGEHGRGGLGRVLRARDKELGRDVAVKELLERGNTSELRFFREALITARLEHPGIVPVHEAGRWPDGTPFYAMKLVQGRSLRALIDDCKTMEDRLALIPHVIAVADAIAYAHDRKIIHRDLKPSNVIVGDFGETVVIDWGLAKDITDEIPEPTEAETGAPRAPAADGLTVAGSVLGTPAYMAPEQREGKADERSDVYALGGILHHISAGSPPNGDNVSMSRGRGSPLRLNVPRDLGAIVARAMSRQPSDRYASATQFAADVRRYTQRRPVAARRYSFAGRAFLGLARHRGVSLVLLAALTMLSIVLAAAAARISDQREVALQSETEAQSQRDRAEQALDSMTLQHAESLLATDPSEASELLAGYRGSNLPTARRIRAEAIGLGVSRQRVKPEQGSIIWAQGVGSDMFTLGYAGTIERTSATGHTDAIARNATIRRTFAFSMSRGLLAYACYAHDVCLLDLAHPGRAQDQSKLPALSPADLAFSPDGWQLAVLSEDGRVELWDIPDLGHMRRLRGDAIANATSIAFADDRTLIAGAVDQLTLADANGQRTLATSSGGIQAWAADPVSHMAALATSQGTVTAIDSRSAWRNTVPSRCSASVSFLQWLPRQAVLGIACQDGTVATWDVRTNVVVLRGHVLGTPSATASSFDGTLLIVGSSAGPVLVVDLVTKLTTTYAGHRVAITSVNGPTPDWPLVTTSDKIGWVRTWTPPARVARLLARLGTTPESLEVLDSPSSVVVPSGHSLMQVMPSGETGSHGPHFDAAVYLAQSHDGGRLAAFGFGATVEVWQSKPLERRGVLSPQDGPVEAAVFMADSETIVTGGHNGAVTIFPIHSPPRLVLQLGQPLMGMWALYPADTLLMVAMDGSLWISDTVGHKRQVAPAGEEILRLRVSTDGRHVVTGDAAGAVRIYDASTWASREVFRANAAVWSVEFSPRGDAIAVATRDGEAYIGRPAKHDWNGLDWTRYSAYVNHFVFSQAGDLLLALGPEGIWVYSLDADRQYHLSLPSINVDRASEPSDAGGMFAVAQGGEILWLSLAQLRVQVLSYGT